MTRATMMLLALLLGGLLALGCGGPSSTDGDADGDVDGDADADGDGDGDGDADADGDVEPAPLRRLETRPLFGEMPIQNRVYDPGFDLVNDTGWIVSSGSSWERGRVQRLYLARAPAAGAVLYVPFGGNPADMQVLGSVMSVAEELSVSVWVGRRQEDADEGLTDATVSLMGYFGSGGGNTAVDVEEDPAAEPLPLDGVVWRRYAGVVTEGPVAWSYLVVSNATGADFFVSGPVVAETATTSGRRPAALAPTSRPRALRPGEERALEQALAEAGRRLGLR